MEKVLIAGASQGLGLVMTQTYLDNQYQVFAGVRNTDNLELKELKQKYDQQLHIVKMDVGDTRSVTMAADEIGSQTDSLDIVVNCAAVLPKDSQSPLEEMDIDSWLGVLNINSLGSLRVVQKVIPFLRKGKNPLIMNISSAGASFTHIIENDKRNEFPYAYCMSKAALNMGSAILKRYCEIDMIRVICVHPGVMATRMNQDNRFRESLMLPETSADCIYRLINNERGRKGDILFFNYSGEAFPY